MDDNLEKFIRSNRLDFDDEEPSLAVWENIRKKGVVDISSNRNVYWKVAAVFFLISTLYLIVDRKINDEIGESVVAEVSDFGQVEAYYIHLIAEKRDEISQFDDLELRQNFFKEIDRLDVLYHQLKKTYKNQNSSDMLSDAMVNNLKLRIDILDQQIKILEKLKKEQDDNESIVEG